MAVAMISRPVFTDVTNVNGYDASSTCAADATNILGRGHGNRNDCNSHTSSQKGGVSSSRCAGGLARDVVPGRRAPLQAVPVGSSGMPIYEGLESRCSFAMSHAISIDAEEIAELKRQHGSKFLRLGSEAEVWIATPANHMWSHAMGQRYIEQLKTQAHSDEDRYYASILEFKADIERSKDTHSNVSSRDEHLASREKLNNKLLSMRDSRARTTSRGANGKSRDDHDKPIKGWKGSKVQQRSDPAPIVQEEPVLRTQLALLIDSYRFSPVMDERVDAVVSELVDEILSTSHRESQRYLPKPEELLTRLGNGQREPILDWLVQACDIMRLPDGIVYSTVLTLDRYCAACREPVATENMQKVLMAVICTVLKTCAVADEVCMPLRDLLLHLCRGQVSFEDILVMEHRVLQTLKFKGLFAPTALEFLEALKTPLTHWLGDAVDATSAFDLANFLIQLSFFNAALHYSHPHLVLAASALYVALCHLQCSPAIVQNLLTDVAAVAPDIADVATSVMTCGTQLHSLWLDFAAVGGDRVPCLLRKFNMNVLLSPPAALIPAPCLASEHWLDKTQQTAWHLWGSSILAEGPHCHNCGLQLAGAPYITPEMTPISALCPNCSTQTYGSLLSYIH